MKQEKFNIGDIVETLHGKGKIIDINTSTYSIPIYNIELQEGRYKKEQLGLVEGQFRKIV